MTPATGERVLRFVGDTLEFALRREGGAEFPSNWRAFLRTNLGRAAMVHEEIVRACTSRLPVAGASWRDIPLCREAQGWRVSIPLAEVGYFKAKAYACDAEGRQFWPAGPDVGITVHPDGYRTGNTIYCAFVRMFGESRQAVSTRDEAQEAQFKALDQRGFTVIPPSGRLRDLVRQLPHIIQTLGCRILHLLPINPMPTTYARFGRYGSPYAALDFCAIDPALVEFDRRTTGVEQFCELTYGAHALGGRVFLDLAINHTGWGSTFQENRPDWFLRTPDGAFASPGAWGTTWEDLVELSHRTPDLWVSLAEAFLVWCRRGVDGFRCDAGYKVPVAAWQYIIARVRQEFPETIFLLEGLGGAWEATESLLAEGGMQWAYSELFQNYSGKEIAAYLDYSLRQSQRAGLWVHYSETHDNPRLAAKGRAWSLLRNRLCALTSVCGGFGFTAGVEWAATEKISVHGSSGMAWGNAANLVGELQQVNRLLGDHPAFFDGAKLTRLSPDQSPVYALRRDSSDGRDHVLVLVNTDFQTQHNLAIPEERLRGLGELKVDLLGQPLPQIHRAGGGNMSLLLPPAACFCLAPQPRPNGLNGEAYRRRRAQAAWALTALCHTVAQERIGRLDWQALADFVVATGPARFLSLLGGLDQELAQADVLTALESTNRRDPYPPVVVWNLRDRQRIVPVPPHHWLLIQDPARHCAALALAQGSRTSHAESVEIGGSHWVAFAPDRGVGEAQLSLQRFAPTDQQVQGSVLFLDERPRLALRGQHPAAERPSLARSGRAPGVDPSALVLLTNGLGGMARLCVDLGRVNSKYDCLLGANLHPHFPVDRQIFAKRLRVWVIADGFLSPLDSQNLAAFLPGPPAQWRFVANAGDGRTVEIHLTADMLEGRNTTVLKFYRPSTAPPHGKELAASCEVRLTVRVDIEDRNFHGETQRNPAADLHFSAHCSVLSNATGFAFTPAPDRLLRVSSSAGAYHHEAEWSQRIPHPVEQSRGQVGMGDAYSPGWFDLPLAKGAEVTMVVSADASPPPLVEVRAFPENRRGVLEATLARAQLPAADAFGRQLAVSLQAFLARRDGGTTVIAGYPWFLDWGRDSLICARGLLAAGLIEDVTQLLVLFGRFEEAGTLPNSIHGADVSNRDTSDAPLWYALVCEEVAAQLGGHFYETKVDQRGRTIGGVLQAIAAGYARGTPNDIRMDADSGLIWSPSHFTWMDTNHPPGTPREGYPVEIQALWLRLLRQLERIGLKPPTHGAAGLPQVGSSWGALADRAEAAFQKLFWLEDRGHWADVLFANPGVTAARATADQALRSNGLFAVSLELSTGQRAQRAVEAALRYLVVPGALRTLAPLPVSPPLPIHGRDGRLLNNPHEPYWGRYEGDEDTRRKPAYHNGTAWTWTFPVFCEALARAWEFSPAATAAARAYLGSMACLLERGCLGHLPEIVDGDAPHTLRGCDAQAWSASEALRVWKLLQ